MAIVSLRPDPTTELEVIDGAIAACRGHEACTAQVLSQRLEPIHDYLAQRPQSAECKDRELAVIEDTLAWFGGIGPAPGPTLTRGLHAIRERLARRAARPDAPAASPASAANRPDAGVRSAAPRR